MIAQQQTFMPCGPFPQYNEGFMTLPQIPVIPGYTPVFIPGPSLSPMAQSLPATMQPLPFVLPPVCDPSASPMNFLMPSMSEGFSVSPGFSMTGYSISPSPSPMMQGNLFVSPPMQLPMKDYNSEPLPQMGNLYVHQTEQWRSTTRSLSPSPTQEELSEFTRERPQSVGSEGEVSKKELVDRAISDLTADFGDRFDTEGLRGMNILRIKVKTRVALEHIVPFIRFCQEENLVELVSCPISTKKGRQHVRGFLAYLQARNEQDADRLCEKFHEYNEKNGAPFKAYQRNPKSTLYKKLLEPTA